MSTAHRPTWDPAQAKDAKGGSRQFSVRDMAMHTKLKFRQVGQTSVGEVKQRDSVRNSKNKKRKADGLPPLAVEGGGPADEESNKRRREDKDADDSSDSDSDDEDDDTAELLRELEKIKRERAEEKARQEREQSAEIATGNPLLNLAAALGQQVPSGVNTTVPGTFAVKKRWDDDLIFKNQAISTRDKPTHFFHKSVLSLL
ncbi:Cwf15/Cwc15 cell cycle control protein-domain-containing protein [Mycena sp. CBHHK59/15]|nr:Cwf15/Cwc15 cell cycle control protein-domain-containing protein [Mycena sp. CBHHK59/15]